MITVEIKINGMLIGHILAVNEAPIDIDTGRFVYRWEYYQPDKSKTLLHGVCVHRREDGCEKLLRKILEEIQVQLGSNAGPPPLKKAKKAKKTKKAKKS